MTILLLSTCICMLSLPAHARIGETQQECVERYGRPIKRVEERNILIFSKSGFRIAVHMHDNKVDMIIYTKINRKAFSDAEIVTLLSYNGSGWKNIPNENRAPYDWTSKNGANRASYTPDKHQLSIATASYLKRSLTDYKNELL